MPPPKGCPEAVHQLMLNCWNKNPVERPSFKRIFDTLDTLLKQAQPSNATASLEDQPTESALIADTYVTLSANTPSDYNS